MSELQRWSTSFPVSVRSSYVSLIDRTEPSDSWVPYVLLWVLEIGICVGLLLKLFLLGGFA